MQQDNVGLQALSSAILDDARVDAARIIADARAEAEAVLRKAKEEAEAKRQEILQKAKAEASHIRRQGIAAANMEAQTLLLSRRERILTDIFEKAYQRLKAAPNWSGYDKIVRDLTREAITHLSAEEAVIHGDDRALDLLKQGMLKDLEKESGVRLHMGEPLTDNVGIIVETVDGHRRYDNTLGTRLNRQKDFIRAEVYRILVGERS